MRSSDDYLTQKASAVLLSVTVAAGNDRRRYVTAMWKPRGRAYRYDDVVAKKAFDALDTVSERHAALLAARELIEELIWSEEDGR